MAKQPEIIRVDGYSDHESLIPRYSAPSFTPVKQSRPINSSYNDSYLMHTANDTRDSSSFMMPAENTPVKEGPLVEKITLEEIDVTETKDARIDDKDEYFNNYETFKVTLPDGKMALNCF